MAIENLRKIGDTLYERRDNGVLYPISKMASEAARREPDAGSLTGFPEIDRMLVSAGNVNQALNPVEAIGQSMGASRRMLAPETKGWDRVAALGDMLSGVGGVVAPLTAVGRLGKPAATALMESLLGGSSLPDPRNEAEAIAKDILEMRATGNVDAVTEAMMNAADPQYMRAHTPLPMDEASRMARAKQMGFGEDVLLHGTPYESFSQFKPSKFGALGPGVYVTKRPVTASDYARGWGEMDVRDTFVQDGQRYTVGGNVLPIRVKGELQSFPDWTANKRDNMELDDLYGPTYKADEAASRMAEEQGFTGVQGRNENSAIFDPRSIRSRFARFDPMFAHLRNLSAGVAAGAVGLEAAQYNPDEVDSIAENVRKPGFAKGGHVQYDPAAIDSIINQLREVNHG